MIVRPGPGLRFTQLHPLGWPQSPLDPGLVAAVVPLYRDRSVAVISFAEQLCVLRAERDEAVVAAAITGYVGAIATGDLSPVHPVRPGPVCTYLQSRRMIRLDTEQRTHRETRLLRGEDIAQFGMWVDAEERRVAVQVEDTSHYDEGGRVICRVDVFDVHSEPRAIGGRELPALRAPGFGWAAGGEVVAIVMASGLAVFDADLQPIEGHPLTLAARRILAEVGATEVQALRVHPTRPLAVLSVCVAENGGLCSYETYRVSWSDGSPEVRALAGFSAIDGLTFGAFAPDSELLDVRAATCGATRLVVFDEAGGVVHDLGIARSLQGACWSTGPLRYLAFDRATQEILIWPAPGGRA